MQLKNKDYLLTVTELKKVLNQNTKEELISLLSECYKSNDTVKEFISARYAGENTINKICELYKEKIYNSFFPTRGYSFKLSEARKAITDFKKLCSDEKLILDLMLFYVEMGVEFTNTYGDINESFYNSMESMYSSVVKALNKQDSPVMYNEFQSRLKAVVDDTGNVGWGFHDTLTEIYYDIQWIEEEEE